MQGHSRPLLALDQPTAATGYYLQKPDNDLPTARKARKQLFHSEENHHHLSVCDDPVIIDQNAASTAFLVSKQTKQTQPILSIPSQLPLRRPLQQLSTNCPPSIIAAPAKHLQCPAPLHQQLQTTHLASAGILGVPHSLRAPAVTSPAAHDSSKQRVVHQTFFQAGLQRCNSINSGQVGPVAPQKQATVHWYQGQQQGRSSAATSADSLSVPAVAYPLLQVQQVSQPRPSSETSSKLAPLGGYDNRAVAPEDAVVVASRMYAWSDAEAQPTASRAAALQHIHSQHPVTQMIQRERIPTTVGAFAQPYSVINEPLQGVQSTRRLTELGGMFPLSTILAHNPERRGAHDTLSSRRSAGGGAISAVAADSAARRSVDRGLQVLQASNASKSEPQVLEVMQQSQGRLAVTDTVIPPPHIARQLISAATRQGYTVHTAVPISCRQQPKPSQPQRGQERLQLPSAAAAGQGCSSLVPAYKAGPLQRSNCSLPAGGSILDVVGPVQRHSSTHEAPARSLRALQPSVAPAGAVSPSNALQDRNKAAALTASALAAGATRQKSKHAEASVDDELVESDMPSMPGVHSNGQSWQHWKSAAGAMLPSQTQQGTPAAEGPTAPQQVYAVASAAGLKLNAAAMPPFLQQHVAHIDGARRAAVAAEAMDQQPTAPSNRQEMGSVSTLSSNQTSCDSSRVISSSPRAVLQNPGHATVETTGNPASLQRLRQLQQHKSAPQRDFGHSIVGHRQAAAAGPLHDGLAHRHSVLGGTAAAAVAQQQQAYAARVLRPHAGQQSSRVAEAAGKLPPTYQDTPKLAVPPVVPLVALPGVHAVKVASPAAAGASRPGEQQIGDGGMIKPQDGDELSPVAHSSDSSCGSFADTAASRVSYRLAPHMLNRTPYVGLGDQDPEDRDFDYVEHAKSRLSGLPYAWDARYVMEHRLGSETFHPWMEQGAKKQLWACPDQQATTTGHFNNRD